MGEGKHLKFGTLYMDNASAVQRMIWVWSGFSIFQNCHRVVLTFYGQSASLFRIRFSNFNFGASAEVCALNVILVL